MAGIPQQQLDKLEHIDDDVHDIKEKLDLIHPGPPVDLGPVVAAIALSTAAIVGAIGASTAAIVGAIEQTNAKLDETNELIEELVGFQTPEPTLTVTFQPPVPRRDFFHHAH